MQGLHTAIVTPFLENGEIDFDAFRALLTLQIDAKVDGVVVCGSTGEGATLTVEEKILLWQTAVEHVAGRLPIMAGTGSNDTRATVELSLAAQSVGVQSLLLVTPFYNKPSSAGLVAHFKAVNDVVSLPIVMYNVPGRTAQNVNADTQLEIAESCANVVATKEASADLEQMCEIIRHAPAHFSLLAGDDSLALPAIACGAKGVIAVISNYMPKSFGNLVSAALNGDFATARQKQMELMPFYKANFLETNPLPVKYVLHKLGMIQLQYRLPLLPPQQGTQSRLDEIVVASADVELHA